MRNLFLTIIIFVIFSGVLKSQGGDNTAPLTIKQLSNGRIQVSVIPTSNYTTFSSVNFVISLPANVTITNPVFYFNVAPVSGGMPNEFGHTLFQSGSYNSGTEYPLMDFTWVSTNPPGTTGDFTIVNDLSNYVEMNLADRSGPANNNANAVPLPIKLSSFSAVKDGDRGARLDWTSSSEVNSAYFGVERSSDGTSWETIGKVNAAGNSSAELAYQYYDRNLPISRSNDQVFYYRLQLVDIDGKYKYSDVRGVNFKGISSTDVISLYPNPTTSMVNIDLREMDINHGTIDLKVVDMAGRYVINKTINGNGIEPIDVSRYDAGSYQVLVTQGSQQHQKRFIKAN